MFEMLWNFLGYKSGFFFFFYLGVLNSLALETCKPKTLRPKLLFIEKSQGPVIGGLSTKGINVY